AIRRKKTKTDAAASASLLPSRTAAKTAATLAPADAATEALASGTLSVRDLVIGVDGGPALVTGVSLEVRPGTVMGLVGESGCGKSVTSYAILGLLSPGLSVRSGNILWNGADLATANEKVLAKVRGHE